MADKLIVKAHANHIDQWLYFKRLFVRLRSSDAGEAGKAVPRTTNEDIRQLTQYWTRELRRTGIRSMKTFDKSRRSRDRWRAYAAEIDAHSKTADAQTLYPHNERFWQVETARLAQYLNSLSVLPTKAELFYESVGEVVAERAEQLAEVADGVVHAGTDFANTLKRGAIVLGGVVGAALIVPPIVRAMRRND